MIAFVSMANGCLSLVAVVGWAEKWRWPLLTWGEIITPIAQKLCDIVALPEMPEASDKCGSCNDAAEYNDLVEAP